jgi:hypothetical protein
MRRVRVVPIIRGMLLATACTSCCALAGDPPRLAEQAALDFLAVEVPKWSQEHRCFSCHNNGDAARALYRALNEHRRVSPQALADTSRFLSQPRQWDRNGPDGPFSDRQLARIQFGAALVEAHDAQCVTDRLAFERAAELIAQDQRADGSWAIQGTADIGSPATYGPAISTWLACRTLQQADPQRYAAAAAKAEAWFINRHVQTVLDAAAVLLGLQMSANTKAAAVRQRSLELIRRGESRTGGWGPYVNSPPEPFDTAVVLLALAPHAAAPEIRAMIARGRDYLAGSQEPDGGWPATTRPPGGESYAQRISTTGWAALALIATSR